jgi:hypothetical protein
MMLGELRLRENLDVRLRLLAAIAATPGLNDADVGDAVGVYDEGQISKLLAQVQSLGLILNTVGDQANPGANSWVATSRGAEIARASNA